MGQSHSTSTLDRYTYYPHFRLFKKRLWSLVTFCHYAIYNSSEILLLISLKTSVFFLFNIHFTIYNKFPHNSFVRHKKVSRFHIITIYLQLSPIIFFTILIPPCLGAKRGEMVQRQARNIVIYTQAQNKRLPPRLL